MCKMPVSPENRNASCQFSSLAFISWKSLEICFLSSKSCIFLCSRIYLWSNGQFRTQNLRMNVHRGSDSDRLLRQEASCLVDDTSVAAQEKEANSLASSGPHNLTYPLVPRNEGTVISSWLNLGGFPMPKHLLYPEGMNVFNLNKLSN